MPLPDVGLSRAILPAVGWVVVCVTAPHHPPQASENSMTFYMWNSHVDIIIDPLCDIEKDFFDYYPSHAF